MVWLLIAIVVVFVVIVIFETRGAMERTERKLEEIHGILLELRTEKTVPHSSSGESDNSDDVSNQHMKADEAISES